MNHFKDVHGITSSKKKTEVVSRGQKASSNKKSNQIVHYDTRILRRSKPAVSALVVPAVSAKKGSTKHYKCLHLQNQPLISEFM